MTCYIFSRIFPCHIIEIAHITKSPKIGLFMMLLTLNARTYPQGITVNKEYKNSKHKKVTKKIQEYKKKKFYLVQLIHKCYCYCS